MLLESYSLGEGAAPLSGSGRSSGAVVTCVVSFQGDSRDTVSTWLLAWGLKCLEPLMFLGQDRKLDFTVRYHSRKASGTSITSKLSKPLLWPDEYEARED